MCELRSYILKNDLETIDEEPDELSQNSRNGARTRSIKSLGGQSGNGNQLGVFLLNNQQQQLQHDILHSQTNTITTLVFYLLFFFGKKHDKVNIEISKNTLFATLLQFAALFHYATTKP